MSKKTLPFIRQTARPTFASLVSSIRSVDDQLAAQAGRAVNLALTLRNWLIGGHIAEYELKGADRARYGERLLSRLSARLSAQGVTRCEERELRRYRQFYVTYPWIGESLTPEMRERLLSPATDVALTIRESATPESSAPGMSLIARLSFTHGQLNTYVTWYRRHMMQKGDNPPIGILLCAQKDHALAEYALAGMDNRLFVSKYQLHLPKPAQLRRRLERALQEHTGKLDAKVKVHLEKMGFKL